MNKTRFVFSIAVGALLVATPAMGQLTNFPILALPAGPADGTTSVGAGWGRGLSDANGKLNSFVVGAAHARERISFSVIGGWVKEVRPDTSSFAFGGSVAYNAPVGDQDTPLEWGVQGGIEYRADDAGADQTTLWNFPIGVSLRHNATAGSLEVPLWIMPRFQWTRTSSVGATPSSTDGTFGVSSGISGVTESGFGIGVSADWTYADDGSGVQRVARWLFGAAAFYRL